jgi:hypothetical protein
MREKIRQTLWVIVKKKWFWMVIILLFVFAIIFDLFVAIIWVVKTLIFTPWNGPMFWIGIAAAVLGALTAKRKIFENKTIQDITKLLFFIALVLAFRDYGFWRGLVFIFGIIFLNRILKWITPKRKVLKRIS